MGYVLRVVEKRAFLLADNHENTDLGSSFRTVTAWLYAALLVFAVVSTFYRYALEPFSKRALLKSAVFEVSPGEKDAFLLQGALKAYRAVGYATDGDNARIVTARCFLAPVLLDLNYSRHDIVMSDYTTAAKDVFRTDPAYTLVTGFPRATDWARSIKIYRKVR